MVFAKWMTVCLAVGVTLFAPFGAWSSGQGATPASQLPNLIRCHEALNLRTDGTSEKMDIQKPTPFVLKRDSMLYFVTATSIASIDLKNSDLQKAMEPTKHLLFVAHVNEENQDYAREIEVRGNGELGSVCCSDGKGKPLPSVEAHAALDDETIAIVKDELSARLKTFAHSYQNDDQQMNAFSALKECKGINFGEADPVGKLLLKYKPKPIKVGKKKAPLNHEVIQ